MISCDQKDLLFYHTQTRDYFNQPIEVDPALFPGLSPVIFSLPADVRPLISDFRPLPPCPLTLGPCLFPAFHIELNHLKLNHFSLDHS